MATHRLELVDRHGRTRIILACVEPPDGGPAIALFSEACEARATLAITPEDPVLSFSTDGNIVAEIGVADIDPATPNSGPYIMLSPGPMAIRCSTSESTATAISSPRVFDVGTREVSGAWCKAAT